MSLSDCPKCWDTPCVCGYNYQPMDLKTLSSIKGSIEKVIEQKTKEIFDNARTGNISNFRHPDLTAVVDRFGLTPLHYLALLGKVEILDDERVSKAGGTCCIKPIHLLAACGKIEVLDHPDVASVTNMSDITPLHVLGLYGVKEVLNHPKADEVKDRVGNTPKYILDNFGKIDSVNVTYLRVKTQLDRFKMLV